MHNSIEKRIERAETRMAAGTAIGPQIVFYPPGKCPPVPPNDGRVRIFLPTNGREVVRTNGTKQ